MDSNDIAKKLDYLIGLDPAVFELFQDFQARGERIEVLEEENNQLKELLNQYGNQK